MENDSPLVKSIAVLGGTGKEGKALARRWAQNGYKIYIGSRSAEKAETAANDLNEDLGGDYVTGLPNEEAAEKASIVVISVPYDAHARTLEVVKEQVQGKILVDITVPAQWPNLDIVVVPEGQSAAQEAQEIVGKGVRVVSAFQNVSHTKLKNPDNYIDCDVLVTGDDAEAKAEVMQMVDAAGMKGIDIGPLANAIVAEALTSALVYINKAYKVKGAGIRITGIE
jgi:hypothetical protein